jgi:uncharacterized protein (DUF433 family)
MFGKPVIKGTKLPVELILEKLALGENAEYLIQIYPRITREDIAACLFYAVYSVKNETVTIQVSPVSEQSVKGDSQLAQMQHILQQQSKPLFQNIADPVAWQKQQRDEWS